jgi:hypothetical protein
MIRIDASQFTRKLDDVLDDTQRAAERAVIEGTQKGAVRILGTAQRSILRSQGGGAVRPRGDTASLPGDPPRNDTGTLARSGRVDPKPNGADVVFGAAYASPLEFGTRNIAPRPFLAPALADETGTTADEAEKVLRRELAR